MKHNLKIALLLFACGSIAACSNSPKSKSVVESLKEGDYESINLQRVIDEGKEYMQLTGVIIAHSKVVDGRVQFNLSKSEFRKKGLDVKYYKQVNKWVKEFNAMLDSEAVAEGKATLKEFAEFLSEKLQEFTSTKTW